MAIGLALLAAGCGGGGSTTVIVHKTVSTQTASTSTATTTQSTSTTVPTSSTTTTTAMTIVHRGTFRSPTGNIGCVVVGAVARCDISHRVWSPPARPPSCPKEVDFGQGLEVGRAGPGRFVCAGDTALNPTAPPLQYGTGSQVGDFLCVSRSTGITCTNRSSGHGFSISTTTDRTF